MRNAYPLPSPNGTSRLKALAILFSLLAFLFVFILESSAAPLDKIDFYEVSVQPQANGDLLVSYYLRWTVLDSTKEGPLEWVKLGVANPAHTIENVTGDALKASHMKNSFIRVDLKRAFHAGETAKFNVTLRQRNLLTFRGERSSAPNASFDYYYRFTPGWFPSIEVQSYRFVWKGDPLKPSWHNADTSSDNYLFWMGSLGPDQRREMQVAYTKEIFGPNAHAFNHTTQSQSQREHSTGLSDLLVSLLAISIVIVVLILSRFLFGFNRGRGFYGGGHGRGGSCACAGCACACACAGGGRAGCSQKDFTRPPT